MRKMLITVSVLCAVVIAGAVLLRHFVTPRALSEDNALPEIPENAELVYLDWTQTSSVSEDGFYFRMRTDSGTLVMSGSYIDAESRDSVEPEDVPVSDGVRHSVEECLRRNAHRAPVKLPEDIEALDGASSELTVRWRCEDGSTVSAVYDGQHENELRGILSGILKNSK